MENQNYNSQAEFDGQQKLITNKNGAVMLIVGLALLLIGIATIIFIVGAIPLIAGIFVLSGCKSVGPNESAVFTLLGEYYGTINEPGYYWINPISSAVMDPAQQKTVSTSADGETSTTSFSGLKPHRVSMKVRTLNNELQKVNDLLGNPVIVGTVVVWRVVNPTKSVFNVDNYAEYLNSQSDTIVRNTIRAYPYENLENDGIEDSEYTLIGSSQMIADQLQASLQERSTLAGIEIIDVKITHISYADEISAAMLQRQQASAIVSARSKIVQGAVGIVEEAITELEERKVVELNVDQRANLVNNLLVVLTSNSDTSPVINTAGNIKH